MKADIIILAVIAAYCAYVVVRRLRKSKEGGPCCGCGGGCSGCGHSCAGRCSYENLFKEEKKD